jgi:spermidine synthase
MATKAARPGKQRSKKQAASPPPSNGETLPRALPWLAASALVFVAAGAVLVLEILAVRLLAPYVGLTLETTTAIIGAALAGISGGAALGGYLADRTNTHRLVVGLLIGGGLLTLLTVPVVRWLGPGARGEGELAALGVTLVALVPAAAVLSAVSPAIAHLQLHNLRRSGTVVGRLSAWGTAGALVGTFGTGFVLVPLMPVSTAVILVGAVLVATGVALGAWARMMSLLGIAGAILAVVLLGAWSSGLHSPCKAETKYHCVSIEADPANPGGYVLKLDDLEHSYVDLRDPTNLEFPYVRWIANALEATNPPKKPLNVVFIGGGGFTLPRWLDATRPGSRGLVLEVDSELIEFDEEHLGLRRSPGLRIETGDARISMGDVPSGSADAVVGDAFGAMAIPWNLATTEWTAEVKRVLKPGGLYALNVIDLKPFNLLKAETVTLLDSFRHLRIVTFGELEHPEGGNAVLLASDRPIPPSADYEVVNEKERVTTLSEQETRAFSAGSEPLRDDYAPADQLLTTP